MQTKLTINLSEKRRKFTLSLLMIFLMISSTTLSLLATEPAEDESATSYSIFSDGELLKPEAVTQGGDVSGQGTLVDYNQVPPQPHPALFDIMWTDPGVSSGVINDMSAILALSESYSLFLEESNKDDHDNDGINDLNDLDDDNDGIYDLLERFDGCYGTDPLDHDNDGVPDVDDWDDDNDGILEGPLDIDALEAQGYDPINVSTDRYLDPGLIHPWTNQPVGNTYLADQNPMDHDNDGVTDEDSDGSGSDRYDEDDDNDGRIDQFKWPCDLDSDGIQDYFDDDDDGDGLSDIEDAFPYDSTQALTHAQVGNLFDAPVEWLANDYLAYSGGVDYLVWEQNRVNGPLATASGFYPLFEDSTITTQGTPAFTQIFDGDLDGDGIPNFIDPDNDNDGIPDSSDTDDDNDLILDMSDPDDDNDGIPDVCVDVDNNGDGLHDYFRIPINGAPTSVSLLNGGSGYSTQSNALTTGGSGTGLELDITSSSLTSGIVSSASITNSGDAYSSASSVSTTTSGAGNGLIVDIVASSIYTGVADVIQIENAGTGYVSATSVSTTGGTGTGLSLSISANNIISGIATSVSIVDPGTFYTDSFSVATSTTGNGNGLTVDITTNAGAVTSISPNSSGSGYAVGDIVTILAGNSNANLTIDVTSSTGGDVTGITVTSGGVNYNVGDIVDITGGNSDAQLKITSLTSSGGQVTSVSLNSGGSGYAVGDLVTINGGNGDAELSIDSVTFTGGLVTSISISIPGQNYNPGDIVEISGGDGFATVSIDSTNPGFIQIPGGDGDGDNLLDCEIDYDADLDDDRLRPFDQNYNAVYDWLDPDMGGTPNPDNLANIAVSGDQANFEYDLDDDQIQNENDSYPLDSSADVAAWNCPTQANPIPANPDPRCTTRRASFSLFNDWDGDGISNWDDIDDDGDGIIDLLDIDWDCDFDNDNDLQLINGGLYRDDGPNNIDSDIDGDGLENSIDWDDDNDGLSDLYDPDDGNCGVVDFDQTDSFYRPYYPVDDGGDLDGSEDGQGYSVNASDYWNLVFHHHPFDSMMLNYNGYDATTQPVTPGEVPEFYWFLMARWNSRNGGNEWDIDTDGDSLINGLDTDQDGDGMPNWWDQDEGNDGIMDIDDPKMGGTFNLSTCGYTAGNFATGFSCGYTYAFAYQMPLNGVNAQLGLPFATRPDLGLDQGQTAGGPSNNWSCTPGAQGGCYHYDYGGDGTIDAGITYSQIADSRDAFIVWLGLTLGVQGWSWNSDTGPVQDFPDEMGADIVENEVDEDIDGDSFNNTLDIDDDADGVYDWFDVDDDNDGIWDYFDMDTNDDLDDDSNITLPQGSSFFTGTNCNDNDDDGNDADADDDGFFQAVWDRGEMTQGYQNPRFYDVDNDNDGVPDAEDYDDDNNGIDDWTQELLPGCFSGEEQSPWDHDNDNISNWADNDWDGDGIDNIVELAGPLGIVGPFDHDNDGLRDDLDLDDDQDGMEDEDENLVWPIRFDRNSTNPWDHDDFGDGEALANPLDSSTGPDAIDNDDDNDTRIDPDFDHLEDGEVNDPCYNGAESSDWDFDNDCLLDDDDKSPTFITLNAPDKLWIDAKTPQRFTGHVDWINPVTSQFEPAPNVPIQINIEWANNGTKAIESIYIPTNNFGNFTYNQYIYPEMLTVGDSSTYRVYAEVTELFAFNGNQSQSYLMGAEANLTANIAPIGAFKSSEQPFKVDFWAHYTADTDRGDYTKLISNIPITFTVRGGPFGNLSSPTNFSGLDGNGYRTDNRGFASVTFIQDVGISGTWRQIRLNASLDNGVGQLPGGYEEIIWDDLTKRHIVVTDANGDPVTGDFTSLYTNTTLPAGDYQVTGQVLPELASEWPFPYLYGDNTEPENVRVMHRMNIDGTMYLPGTNPVYYFDGTINNGDGTFGNWATLFHADALTNAGLNFNEVSAIKPYPTNWDGNPASLSGEAALLRPFIAVDGDDWAISLVNAGNSNLPPCGAVDPTDPNSQVRCEIVPEMNTGESYRVVGTVTNRTLDPWVDDPITLQIDIDGNGQFIGQQETQFTSKPTQACSTCDAVYDYNFTWLSQYPAKTYGTRVDFTNSAFYFTGNTSTLSPTGAYINITVIGTTDFQMTSTPRLYRNTSTVIQAKLVDNSLQPVRNAPVNYTWSFDGRTGVNYTDDNGFFEVPFTINSTDSLGNFSLEFEYPGSKLLKGSAVNQYIWVISRTNITVTDLLPRQVQEEFGNFRKSGDSWNFVAQITDDGANDPSITPVNLNGAEAPSGGLVDVIFEGTDFQGVTYRQLVATIAPLGAGQLTLPQPIPGSGDSHLCYFDGNNDEFSDWDTDQDGVVSREESVGCLRADISPLTPAKLSNDPAGFLPDGFGPVNVILRYEESLPNEGCQPFADQLDFRTLGGAWDPCTFVPNNEKYRIFMPNIENGFNLIGTTYIDAPDEEIVYTGEFDIQTQQYEDKPMVLTGRLYDELGNNLSNRVVSAQYTMKNDPDNQITKCNDVRTDETGTFVIECDIEGVQAGQADINIIYSALNTANRDQYRYKSKTLPLTYQIFSNSTLSITDVGPFKSTTDKWLAPNGTEYYRLFLKESFHIDAILKQSNGDPVGDKCLNLYLDPEENIRPIARIRTSQALDDRGTITWFSGDPLQNPTLKGVETTGGKTEGFRVLRVAYEPTEDLSNYGGCARDADKSLNGSFMDVDILVRSRVDIQVQQTWSYRGDNGLSEGDAVIGEIALLRDRLDLAVENEEVFFLRQFYSNEGEWVTDGENRSTTNEQGIASFEWAFDGRTCGGQPCQGLWRIIAYYPGSTFFAPSQDNISHEIQWREPISVSADTGFFTPGNTMALAILLMALFIGGILYYQRSQARRQVQALRGILTDTMLQLEASNEFIAAIFDCYKNLVRHFRKYGFMKKVYETTREFEAAVRSAFEMVPSEQLDAFLTIFEEARYSDHTIDASHRDRAVATLGMILQSLNVALGEGMMVKRFDDVNLYDNQIKAGEFVAADGSVRQAGIVDGQDSNFKI